MQYLKTASRFLLALLVGTTGIMHFVNPEFFTNIMPPYLPWHLELVWLSGAIEITLAVGLMIPATSRWAAWGMIALFIAVFPANIHLFLNQDLMPDVPPVAHLLRLPMQLVFILWAFWHTRPEPGRATSPAPAAVS